jgi:hypothetical protein
MLHIGQREIDAKGGCFPQGTNIIIPFHGLLLAVSDKTVILIGFLIFVGIDNKRSRTQSPDTWKVTSDTWNGTQTHPQIKPLSHRNDDGLQNHGNLATLQAHI